MENYQNLCTEFYDLDKPEAPADELKFYLEYVEKAQGPILEPMCGSGRLLIPFLEKGFAVEGLDASLHMMKACLRKCAAKKLEPTLYSQFLNEMSLDKQYALIFIPCGSLGLITDKEELKVCLKNLFNHLLPNGKLVFEIETINGIPKNLGIWHGRMRTKSSDSKIIVSHLPTYDSETQTLQVLCRYDLVQNTQIMQTEIEEIHTHLYQHEEMDNLLEDTGFKDKNILRFKAYGRAEPDENDAVIVYECIK